jgi:hypothetical protein
MSSLDIRVCKTDEDIKNVMIAENSFYGLTVVCIGLIVGARQFGFQVPVSAALGTGLVALGAFVTTGIRITQCGK